MVHSPTDDLFSTQQWEHWAMIWLLVLGLVVGYGQAAAEDRRRAQRRLGGSGTSRARRSRKQTRRSQPSPRELGAIAARSHRQPSKPVPARRPRERSSAASQPRHPSRTQYPSGPRNPSHF